jgi:hypothetical protein
MLITVSLLCVVRLTDIVFLTNSRAMPVREDVINEIYECSLADRMRTTGEDEEEDMTEIDTSNIINDGRRTRGKTIDFAKAAENAGDELEEDEDDDEDFEAAGEGDGDEMQE